MSDHTFYFDDYELVVLHDDATWSEQVDNLVVADAAVREHRVERRALRQVVAPIAGEELDIREPAETVGRDRDPVEIELHRHERARRRGHRRRALSEGRADFRTSLAGGQNRQHALHLRE